MTAITTMIRINGISGIAKNSSILYISPRIFFRVYLEIKPKKRIQGTLLPEDLCEPRSFREQKSGNRKFSKVRKPSSHYNSVVKGHRCQNHGSDNNDNNDDSKAASKDSEDAEADYNSSIKKPICHIIFWKVKKQLEITSKEARSE